MASTVFGVPILNETLKTIPQYANKANPTQVDRAEAALLYKNAQEKDTNARKFVDELRKDYHATEGNTGCVIYNATGDRITLVSYYDISGRVARSPYPIFIENGQWGVFLHGRFGPTVSIGAVVYEGKNGQGQKTQWLLSWKVPNSPTLSVCYTDIRNTNEEQFNLNSSKQQWESALVGPVVNNTTGAMVHIAGDVGSKVYATIGNTPYAICEAILTVTDP